MVDYFEQRQQLMTDERIGEVVRVLRSVADGEHPLTRNPGPGRTEAVRLAKMKLFELYDDLGPLVRVRQAKED